MIKTVVVPQDNNITLSVPNSYIGKKIEVLLYATDELTEEKKQATTTDAAKFKGLLTKEEAEKYHKYISQARDEWERDI